MKKIYLSFLFIILTLSYLFSSKVYIVKSSSIALYDEAILGFRETMTTLGLTDKDIEIEILDMLGDDAVASEIIQILKNEKNISAIYSLGARASEMISEQITNVPIVFSYVLNWKSYPSLNNTNVTGIEFEIPPNVSLTMFDLIAPEAKKIGIIYDESNSREVVAHIQSEAKTAGFEIITHKVTRSRDVAGRRGAFNQLIQQDINAIWMIADPTVLTRNNLRFLIEQSNKIGIPSFTVQSFFVQTGALFAIAPDYRTIGSQSFNIVMNIVNGESPKNIPVRTPMGSDNYINNITAQNLNIEIDDFLTRMFKEQYDEVIAIASLGDELFADRYAAEEAFFALQEVTVVTASKTPQRLADAPAAISVVTAEDIKNFGYKTVGEALNHVPGVFMSTDRSNEYAVMRGMHFTSVNNSKILVLLNGYTLNEGAGVSVPLGPELGIPMAAIERIEVLRGPGSVMYGSNAFLGVVNIILKTDEEEDKYYVETNIGEHKLFDNSVIINKSFSENNSLFFTANIRTNDGFPMKADYDYTFEDWGYYLSWNGDERVSKGDKVKEADFDEVTSFIGNWKYNNFEIISKYSNIKEGMPLADWGQVFAEKDKNEKSDNFFIELKYDYEINPDINLFAKIFTSQYKYENKLFFYEEAYDEDDGWWYENADGDTFQQYNWKDRIQSKWHGAEARISSRWMNGLLTSMTGIEYISRDNKADFNTWDLNGVSIDEEIDYMWSEWQKKKINSFALYNELSYAWTDNFKSLLGLRYDKLTDLDGELSPRLAFLYEPDNRSNYKFIIGKAFRPASFKEYAYDDAILTPNYDLEPEIVYSIDLITTSNFNNNRLDIGLFYSDYKDMIILNEAYSYDDDLGDYRMQYQNPFEMYNYGIEASLKGVYNNFSYFINALIIKNNQKGTIIYSDDQNDTEAEDYDEKVTTSPSFNIVTGICYKLEKIILSTNLNYVNSRTISWGYEEDDESDDFEYPTKTKNNLTLDLNITSNPKYFKNIGFAVTVKDVFDSKRQEPARSISWLGYIPREGRKILGSISYKF